MEIIFILICIYLDYLTNNYFITLFLSTYFL